MRYEASPRGVNTFALFVSIIRELSQSRWLIWQLFLRDFTAGYKQYLLGFLWIVVVPFASLVTLLMLKNSGIFSFGELSVPYPVFALAGISFWQLFAVSLVGASNSMVNAGHLIGKINFCRKGLVLAALGQGLVSFLIQVAFLAAVIAYYHVPLSVGAAVGVLFALIPLVLFTLGLGFILSVLTVVVRDISAILSMMLAFLMVVTPVLYQRPVSGILAVLTRFNPLYYLVCGCREILLGGSAVSWKGFAAASLCAVALFVCGILFFHVSESKIAERV